MFSLRMTRYDFSDALLYVYQYTQIELLTIQVEIGLSVKRYFFGDPAFLILKGHGSASGRKVNM